jgi:hypothetical protein
VFVCLSLFLTILLILLLVMIREMQVEMWYDEPESHCESFIALAQIPDVARPAHSNGNGSVPKVTVAAV